MIVWWFACWDFSSFLKKNIWTFAKGQTFKIDKILWCEYLIMQIEVSCKKNRKRILENINIINIFTDCDFCFKKSKRKTLKVNLNNHKNKYIYKMMKKTRNLETKYDLNSKWESEFVKDSPFFHGQLYGWKKSIPSKYRKKIVLWKWKTKFFMANFD